MFFPVKTLHKEDDKPATVYVKKWADGKDEGWRKCIQAEFVCVLVREYRKNRTWRRCSGWIWNSIPVYEYFCLLSSNPFLQIPIRGQSFNTWSQQTADIILSGCSALLVTETGDERSQSLYWPSIQNGQKSSHCLVPCGIMQWMSQLLRDYWGQEETRTQTSLMLNSKFECYSYVMFETYSALGW